jgi:hypothetical protein
MCGWYREPCGSVRDTLLKRTTRRAAASTCLREAHLVDELARLGDERLPARGASKSTASAVAIRAPRHLVGRDSRLAIAPTRCVDGSGALCIVAPGAGTQPQSSAGATVATAVPSRVATAPPWSAAVQIAAKSDSTYRRGWLPGTQCRRLRIYMNAMHVPAVSGVVHPVFSIEHLRWAGAICIAPAVVLHCFICVQQHYEQTAHISRYVGHQFSFCR